MSEREREREREKERERMCTHSVSEIERTGEATSTNVKGDSGCRYRN